MKKLALLTLALGFSSFAFGKEAIVQPVMEEEIVQEIVVAPAPIIEAPVMIETSKNHLYFRFGGDVYSKYSKYSTSGDKGSVKLSNGKTKGFGYEFALEGTRSLTDNFELGLGVAYQGHNKNKTFTIGGPGETVTVGKYDSVPVYVTGKYNFNTESQFKPYLKANLGYSFNINEKDTKIGGESPFKTTVKNGLYTGIGAGVEYNNFLVDLMYQTNFAKASLKDKEDGESLKKSKLDYSRVTLSVGYKLDI